LDVVKFTTVSNDCFKMPVLTEDFHIVQNHDIFNNMPYVRYVHFKKGQAYT
jgi:hypothetical protein